MKQPKRQLSLYLLSGQPGNISWRGFLLLVLILSFSASGCALCQKKGSDPFSKTASPPPAINSPIDSVASGTSQTAAGTGSSACPCENPPASGSPSTGSVIPGSSTPGTTVSGTSVPGTSAPGTTAAPAPAASESSQLSKSVPVTISPESKTPGGSVTENTPAKPDDAGLAAQGSDIREVHDSKQEDDGKDDILSDPQGTQGNPNSVPGVIPKEEMGKDLNYSNNNNENPYKEVSQSKENEGKSETKPASADLTEKPAEKPAESQSEEIPAQKPSEAAPQTAQYCLPSGTCRVNFSITVIDKKNP